MSLRPWICLALTLGALSPAAALGDDGVVVVTASRREEAQDEAALPVEVLTAGDIEASGAVDLADLLALLPGLEVVGGFAGDAIRIRGMDPEYVVLLVDGVRVNGRVDGAIDLSRIPLDDVERVEIVKGPASALYGSNAMGGVIQVITRRPARGFGGEAMASGGTLGLVDATAATSGGSGAARGRLTVGYHQRAAWDLDPSDLGTTGSAQRQGEAAARGELTLGGWGALAAQASYLRRRSEGVDSPATGAIFDRTNLTEVADASARLGLTPTARDHARVGIGLSLFRDQYLSDQRGSDQEDSYNQTRDTQLQLDAQWDRSLGARAVASFGAEGLGEALSTARLQGGDAHRGRASAFAQVDARPLAGRLAVVPGVRVDLDTQFGAFASPKLALRATLRPALTLRASVGRGYRAPDFKELYLAFENPGAGYRVDGNPLLRPERSWQGDVGGTLSPASRLRLDLSLFYTAVDDLIDIDTAASGGDVAVYTYVNQAQARLVGGEAGLRALVAPGLWATLGYTLLDARDGDGLPLEGRARHRGTAELRWSPERPRLTAQLRAALSGPRPFYLYDAEEGDVAPTTAPPSALVDGRVAFAVNDHVDLFLAASNLLDVGDPITSPLPPRAARLGVSGRF